MKITFDHLQEQNINASGKITPSLGEVSKSSKGCISGVMLSKGEEGHAYGKQGKTAKDVQDSAGLLSAEDYNKYMTVMSHTMSEEDYGSMVEEGVKPGKTQVGDAVTIMDHIKTVMAKSGVVLSGFNAGGDIPMEKLEAMAGNPAYAASLAQTFAENDVPLTEENVAETIKQTELATGLTELTEGMKEYVIENGCELTVDELYRAKFSAGKEKSSGKGSYFADDLSGYYGKTTKEADFSSLGEQIEKVIKEAGLPVNEETTKEAGWLLEKGLLLTEENLEKLHRMNEMQLPMSREKALSQVAQALREGKQAKEADLSKDGIYKQAEVIAETVKTISDEAVREVVARGEVLNIRNLAGVQRQIDLGQFSAYGSEKAANADTGEASLIHARRTLEEVRLQMTISANVALLRSDYAIDTTELSQLVEDLKAAEDKWNQTQGLSLPEKEKNLLFADTMEKTTAIRQMPAAVIPRIMGAEDHLTLQRVYDEGRILESAYQKAGESYEALMTAPRADLGDRLKDAFSNIDDILQDLDFELTKDNRRSVRILAYNQMELTRENIAAVRATDADLRNLLDKMTPSATLQMIRDGVNPLEETVSDLMDYFAGQDNDLTNQAESFSRFLYDMDHSDGILPEERETYMGIYRLLRQIENGDGKAIGTVVANGQELTFANLLSAVRTGQKRGINEAIGDDFGLLEQTNTKGSRISDQINHYYEIKAAEILQKLDAQQMQRNQVSMETTWEELMEMAEGEQKEEVLSNAYRKEQLSLLRQDLSVDDSVVEFLLANKQPITPDTLHGGDKLMKRRGEMFKKAAELLEDSDEEIMDYLSKMTEDFVDADTAKDTYEQVQTLLSERLEEKMLSGDMGYLDVKALSSLSKQLSLSGNLAKEEHYELPAVIDGQLTGVNVRFRHEDSDKKGSVVISAELANGVKLAAEWKVQSDSVTGYMGCSDRVKLKQLEEKRQEFAEKILLETGKKADINFVYSEEIKLSYYDGLHQAGKQMKRGAKNLEETNRQSEEVQGSHTSAKELYRAAKVFITLLSE